MSINNNIDENNDNTLVDFLKCCVIVQSVGPLTECSSGAICGLVEVNAFGLNTVPLCSCPNTGPTCPLVWDQEDGRTITLGPKQYKVRQFILLTFSVGCVEAHIGP